MLNQTLGLYQNKEIKKAYETAENAYWNVYDNVLEIKYRSYATPAYIFSVESELLGRKHSSYSYIVLGFIAMLTPTEPCLWFSHTRLFKVALQCLADRV